MRMPPRLLFLTVIALSVVSYSSAWSEDVAKGEKLRVATCQFPVSGSISENADWIRRQMRQAHQQQADVVHFSEVALSGYAGVDRPNMSDYDWELHDRELQSILDCAKELQL